MPKMRFSNRLRMFDAGGCPARETGLRISVIAVAAVSWIGMIAPASGQLLAPAPRIEFEPTELDFGVTVFGDASFDSVRIWNRGDDTLEIRDLIKECGCTAVTLRPDQRKIAPGESIELQIAIRPDRPQHQHRFRRKLTFVTNDPDNPRIEFPLVTPIHLLIVADPPTLTVENVVVGEVARERIVLRATDEEPFTIRNVELPDGPIRAQPLSKASALEHEIELVIGPVSKAGNIYRDMLVHTSNARMREIKIPLRVKVIPLVAVTPQRVHLGRVWPGTVVPCRIQLLPAPGRSVDWVQLNVEAHPQLRATASRIQDAPDTWNVDFAIPLEYAGKVLGSRVLVQTNVEHDGATGFIMGAQVKQELDLAPDIPTGAYTAGKKRR